MTFSGLLFSSGTVFREPHPGRSAGSKGCIQLARQKVIFSVNARTK